MSTFWYLRSKYVKIWVLKVKLCQHFGFLRSKYVNILVFEVKICQNLGFSSSSSSSSKKKIRFGWIYELLFMDWNCAFHFKYSKMIVKKMTKDNKNADNCTAKELCGNVTFRELACIVLWPISIISIIFNYFYHFYYCVVNEVDIRWRWLRLIQTCNLDHFHRKKKKKPTNNEAPIKI